MEKKTIFSKKVSKQGVSMSQWIWSLKVLELGAMFSDTDRMKCQLLIPEHLVMQTSHKNGSFWANWSEKTDGTLRAQQVRRGRLALLKHRSKQV